MNRCLLVLLSGLILQVALAAQDSLPLLPLEDAVRMAQENNRSIKSADLAASISGDQAAEARTYRFPSINLYALGSQLLTPLDFTFARGIFGTFPGVGPIPAQDTNIHTPLRPTLYGTVHLIQPLSQQYKIGLKIRLADLNKTVGEEKLRAQKQAVADQVKQSYYSLVQTQSALLVSTEALSLYRELGRVVQQQVEQQAALKADAMDIQAKVAQEEYNQQMLHDTLATQKEHLNQLLGRDVRTEFSVAALPDMTVTELDLESARAKALAGRPELRQARLAVQQAEINRRITKSEYIPDVSLAVNNLSLVNVNPLLPSNVASAGILVSWDPIDWGRRKHELAEGTKTIEQARNSVSDAEAQVLVEVGDKFRRLGQSRSLLRASDLALAAAREKLRLTMNQYEQKTVLMTDVLQQKTAVQSATDQYQKAVLGFWTAKADFEKSLGED